MTSGLETEWEYSDRMGKDAKSKKIDKRLRKEKVKDSGEVKE